MKRATVFAPLIATLSIACDGATVDAGGNQRETRDHDAGGGSDSYHWLGEVSNSTGLDCPYDAPPAYLGTWEGAFDAPSPLPDGATSIRIDVRGRSAQGLCGTVTFGYESEPPPLPVDATSPYAPGLPGDPAYYERSIVDRFRPVLGFHYEFGHASSDAGPAFWLPDIPEPTSDVSLVDIALHQPYKAWCNLQTSYARVFLDMLLFDCLAPAHEEYASSPEGCRDGETPVSCTQLTLCSQPSPTCTCSSAGCTAGDVTSGALPVVHLDGDSMMGTIDLDGDDRLDTPSSFRLTRVQP